jgi:MFS family permease
VGFLLSLYLQYIKALTPQEAGLILIAQPVMQVIFSPLAGRFSDKVEPRFLATAGIGLSVIGLGLLIMLDDSTGTAFLVGMLVLLGTGFGLFSAPNTNAVMSSVGKKYFGVAAGTLGSFRSLGMMFSLGIVMVVFSAIMGKVQVTPEVYPRFLESVRVLFIIFTALSVLGTVASLFRGNMQGGPAKG